MISHSYSLDQVLKGLGKGVGDLFLPQTLSAKGWSPKGRRGEENDLPANSNRWDSNMGPFGPQCYSVKILHAECES